MLEKESATPPFPLLGEWGGWGEEEKGKEVEREVEVVVGVMERLAYQMLLVKLSRGFIRNFMFRMSDLVELPYEKCDDLLGPYEGSEEIGDFFFYFMFLFTHCFWEFFFVLFFMNLYERIIL